jgi:hypothetical protein
VAPPQIGLMPPHRLRGRSVWWTDERIEAQLRRFVVDCDVFPTRREFLDAGEGALLGAMRRHNGPNAWAARMGLPRREPHSGCVGAWR